MLADYHVHTRFSDDSAYSMERAVRDAIRRGIDELCFTDHVDYGVIQDWQRGDSRLARRLHIIRRNTDYPAYFARIADLRKAYGGRIVLKQGLEFGVQTGTIDAYRSLFSQWELDFVLLSVHEVDDLEFTKQEYQRGRTQRAYNAGYYRELYDVMTRYSAYSVLAHLDLIKRYDRQGPCAFEDDREIVTEILRRAIQDGKGIEVNTSSFRYGLPDLMPCTEILSLYRALGGEILTIGSDAHRSAYLGAQIPAIQRRLREMGYRYFCTFERMTPRFHTLCK